MRMSNLVRVILVCVFCASLVSSLDWAPAGASRTGQTVPTPTPTALPVTPTLVLTAPPTSAPTSTVTPQATPSMLLPVAGDTPDGGTLVAVATGLGLALLVWAAQLRARRVAG